MEDKIKKIEFALLGVSTEQFAIFDEKIPEEKTIRFSVNIRFASKEEQKLISSFAKITFEAEEKIILLIEAGCHFKVLDSYWAQMLNEKTNILEVPRDFMSHLGALTVSTARGILHAKTENTCFNKYVLPTINVNEIVTSDATFDFNTNKKE